MRLTPMQVAGGFIGLSLVVGGGSLWSGYAQAHSQAHAVLAAEQRAQAEQRAAGRLLEQKLCTTFGKLGALKPPEGDPRTNPSRAYLQGQHDTLIQLGADLGCKTGRP